MAAIIRSPRGYVCLALVAAVTVLSHPHGVVDVQAIAFSQTPPPLDGIAPSVSMTAPIADATVWGTVTVNATATDNVAVAGVQFAVDGIALGAEITAAPYTAPWITQGATDLIFGVVKVAAGPMTISAGSGLTRRQGVSCPTCTGDDTVSVDKIQSTAATAAATFTFSAPAHYLAQIAVFKAATTPVYLQGAAATTNVAGTTLAKPFPAPTTAGSLLVAAVAWQGTAPLTVTDTLGNSYAVATTAYDAVLGQSLAILYASNVTAGATTVTAGFGTLSPAVRRLEIHEYAGIASINALGGVATNSGDGTTAADAVTSGAAPTTATAPMANGSHTLTAVARDAAGNTATSAVTVTVFNDATPPTVSITSPTTGTTVTGMVTATVDAADDGAIAGVQFQVDGVPLGAETAVSPYTAAWKTQGSADLVFGAVKVAAAGISISAGSGFKKRLGIACSTCTGDDTVSVDTIQSAPGPAGAAFTFSAAAPYLAHMAAFKAATSPVYLQGAAAANNNGNTTIGKAFGSPATAGSLVVVVVGWQGNVPLTMTDNRSNAYAVAATAYDAVLGQSLAILYAANVKGGATTVTARFGTAVTTGRRLEIHEYAGMATSNPLDVTATNSAAGTTTPDAVISGSAATTVTAPATNDNHTLIAVARDAAGNRTTSVPVTITVDNDTSPPVISNVTASSVTASGATISWTTNEPSTSQVNYGPTTAYASTNALNVTPVTTHAMNLGGLVDGTLYHVRVRSLDATGNLTLSSDITLTTADATPPSVSITAPAAATTVSASVPVTASVGDNVGVMGVQFQLDGAMLGGEDTASPYSVAWDTTTAANTSHTLSAIARDAAGNRTTSAAVIVTVSNEPIPLPTAAVTASPATIAAGAASTLTWSTAGATTVAINQTIGTVTAAGTRSVSPAATTTYTLTATNAGGSVTAATTVTVTSPPNLNTKARANAYDDAWQAGPTGWVANAQAILAGGTGQVPGLVAWFGDSLTRDPALGAWAQGGAGKTAEDQMITNWMHAGLSPQSIDSIDGFALATPYTCPARSYTVGNGLGAWHYMAWSTMPTETNPAAARQLLQDCTTYPNALNLTTILSAIQKPQFAIAAVNLDGANPGAFPVFEQMLDQLIANGIVPIIITYTYRNNDAFNLMVDQYNTALVAYAQAKKLPLIDLNQEMLARVPFAEWSGRLLADGVHEYTNGTTTYPSTADPYANGGDAATHTTGLALTYDGYGLKGWLAVQKMKEIKALVVDALAPPLPTATLSASPAAIIAGAATTLTWSTTNAVTVSIDQSIGTVAAAGTRSVSPTATTTYTLTATNATGSVTDTASVTVTVPDTTPPVISAVVAVSITTSAATISWTTNEPSDSQVDFGPTTAYGSTSVLNAAAVTAHTVTLSGLTGGTLYHVRVRSRDATGNLALSGDVTMTTLDGVAPVVSITAPAGGITVSASVPLTAAASDSVGVMGVQFRLDGALLGTEDTTPPYSMSWNTTTASNASHTLTAVARDAAGNRTTSAAVTVTVSNDTTPPAISAVITSSITTSGAAVSWTTNEASDSQLDFGLTAAYGSTSALNATLVTAHTVSLSGLANGRLYHVRVRSRDAAGSLAVSGDVTFTTLDTMPPTVSITAPAAGTTISGTAIVNATATDNAGVAGVQFAVDGVSLGAEITVAPYTAAWTTRGSTDLIFGVVKVGVGGMTINAGSGSTKRLGVSCPGCSGDDTASVDKIQSTAGTAAAAFTFSTPAHYVAHMAAFKAATTPVHLQDAAATSNTAGTSLAQPFAAPTTSGSLLVVAVAWQGTAPLTVTDTRGNSYAVATTVYDAVLGQTLAILYAANATAGATTVTAGFGSLSPTLRRLAIHEYAGMATTNPLDGTATNIAEGTTTANAVTSGAAATTVTTAVTDGSHTLTAVARDAAGNAATSAAVTVTVRNDATSPTVSISAPAAGAFVAGTVTVTANASDNTGVVGVQFKRDGILLGAEDTTSPYSASWTTTTVTNGTHTLAAVARDAGGNATTSAVITVTVSNDTTPPAISAVTVSSLQSSGVTIGWTTNEVSNTEVEYGLTTAYGGFSALTVSLVTAHTMSLGGLAPNTLYHLRARSRDAAGNLAVSGDFTLTTLEGTPPSVSITAPASGSTVSGTVTVTANASDNIGVVGVEFRLDGVPGLEDTLAPYTVLWDTTAQSPGIHTLTAVARDAAGNRRTSAVVTVTVANATSELTLAWDASTDPTVVGVNVYVGTASGVYAVNGLDAGNVTSYTVNGLQAGTVYYIAVKGYDQLGVESGFSNEVSATGP